MLVVGPYGMVNLVFVGIEHIYDGTDCVVQQFELSAVVELELSSGLHYPALDADGLHFGIVCGHYQFEDIVLTSPDPLDIAEATVIAFRTLVFGEDAIRMDVFVYLCIRHCTLRKTLSSLAHTEPI